MNTIIQHSDGTRDERYTCRLEWCGHPERRFVIRFCGQWIVQARTLGEAVAVAEAHNKHRMG